MKFLKRIVLSFSKTPKEQQIKQQTVNLSLDDSFVHNFINKGGKFLYCTSTDEVILNLKKIFIEENWNEVLSYDSNLLKLANCTNIKIVQKFSKFIPFFTSCEHLIAGSGEILFSSNQLGSNKISSFSDNFIVYATTSQLVNNTGEGLTGIKNRYTGNIPTNISAVKNFSIQQTEESFMDYGNTNSKNVYLLLLEDL